MPRVPQAQQVILPPQRKSILPNVISAAAIGWIGCALFTNINPFAAALFNGAAEVTNLVANDVISKSSFNPSDKWVVKTLLGYGTAFVIANQVANLTISQAVKIFAINIITPLALFVIFGSSVLLGAGIIAIPLLGINQLLHEASSRNRAIRRPFF